MKKLRVPADALKWVAAGCALVATASAEYEIARTIGMHPWVAAAVPGALDAYVLRALRAHREVLTAVLAMVGVNAASHLVTAGLIPLDWRLVTAVSAIAPLVLWRVHALGTGARTEEHTGTVSVPEDAPPPLPVRVPGEHVSACLCVHGGEHESLCVCSMACTTPCGGVTVEEPHPDPSLWSEHSDENGAVLGYSVPEDEMRDCPVFGCGHGEGHVGECLILPPVPAHVPEQWSTPTVLRLVKEEHAPVTETVPVCSCEHGPEKHNEHGCYSFACPCLWRRSTETVLGPEHVPTEESTLELARALMARTGGVPTVRALKRDLKMGTPKAQRVHAVLKAEHAEARAEKGEQ